MYLFVLSPVLCQMIKKNKWMNEWMGRWMDGWWVDIWGLNLWLVSGELGPTLGPGLAPFLCNEAPTFAPQSTSMWSLPLTLPPPTIALKVQGYQWPAWITTSSLFLVSGSHHLLCELPPGALASTSCGLMNVLHWWHWCLDTNSGLLNALHW